MKTSAVKNKVVQVFSPAGSVSVQWIAPTVGIVRFHGDGEYGSPFTFSFTMVRDGIHALFHAANGVYTRAVHRAMRDAMWALGIKRVHYERRGATVRRKDLTR